MAERVLSALCPGSKASDQRAEVGQEESGAIEG